MSDVVIYHNPRCSKSRGALAILEETGVDVEIVEYLKTPPDRATLEGILDAIDDNPDELVRRDPAFKELGLTRDDVSTREGALGVLVEHPELMQRPVVIRAGKGVIARPPEKVSDVL